MKIVLDNEYQLRKEEFIELIKDYPLVPFLVTSTTNSLSREFYRWNTNRLEKRYVDRTWNSISLSDVENDTIINVSVLKSAFITSMDEVADKVIICIEKKNKK